MDNGTATESSSPEVTSFRDCNADICPYNMSFYMYRIDLAPNIVFLSLFSISLLGYLAVYLLTRRALSFTISLCLGLLCEILGYIGRVISWENQWDENGFLMQICCLTIGPAFMAAGIYFCLQKIVLVYGPENSRLQPGMYPRIFIPCDVVSLLLQASGGGLASVASNSGESTETGQNIMIAGLAFQVATILVFVGLSLDFALRTVRNRRAVGANALDQNPVLVQLRGSFMFRACLCALGLATLLILWRSVFRVAELSGGWTGPLMEDQNLFYGMEGIMIVVACLVLNVFHPSLGLKGVMDVKGTKLNHDGHTAKNVLLKDVERDLMGDSEAQLGQNPNRP